MAFSFTMKKKTMVEGGFVVEEGTWNGDSVTTGNITVDTATQPEIIKITEWSIGNDNDANTAYATDVAPTTLKLTFGSGNTGTYLIKGKAA